MPALILKSATSTPFKFGKDFTPNKLLTISDDFEPDEKLTSKSPPIPLLAGPDDSLAAVDTPVVIAASKIPPKAPVIDDKNPLTPFALSISSIVLGSTGSAPSTKPTTICAYF